MSAKDKTSHSSSLSTHPQQNRSPTPGRKTAGATNQPASHKSTSSPASSNRSSRKSAPPLQFRTHPSNAYAALSFCLHLLALTAVFGSVAHIIHFLANEYELAPLARTNTSLFTALAQTGQPGVTLASQTAKGFIALLLALIAVLVLLRSAVHTHRDACKRLLICWQDRGHFRIYLERALAGLPTGTHKWHHCVLDKGCYTSHWAVVLWLCPVDADENRLERSRFCILIMRDAVEEQTFRHLRLWMKLVAPGQLSINRSS